MSPLPGSTPPKPLALAATLPPPSLGLPSMAPTPPQSEMSSQLRTSRAPRAWRLRVLYPVVGALVGLGIEAGLLVVRLLDSAAPLSAASVLAEISGGAATYIYLALVLSTSLALLGNVMGRKEDALRVTSVTDSLTRVVNRRGFDDALASEVARAREAGMPLSLLVLDVDHFKSLNDEHGHKTGDLALRIVADVLRVTCRSRDLPARIGGDEFGVLAPRTTGAEAAVLAERIRVALANVSSMGELGRMLSISIGVADLDDTEIATPAALLDAADRALYRAKTGGRGRVARLASSTDEAEDAQDEVTAIVRCAPPTEPCARDANYQIFGPLHEDDGDEAAANSNETTGIRVSEIRPVSGSVRGTEVFPGAAPAKRQAGDS